MHKPSSPFTMALFPRCRSSILFWCILCFDSKEKNANNLWMRCVRVYFGISNHLLVWEIEKAEGLQTICYRTLNNCISSCKKPRFFGSEQNFRNQEVILLLYIYSMKSIINRKTRIIALILIFYREEKSEMSFWLKHQRHNSMPFSQPAQSEQGKNSNITLINSLNQPMCYIQSQQSHTHTAMRIAYHTNNSGNSWF